MLRMVAAVTTAAIYVQIIVGATMRHTGAGLAIPDFPWAFGRLIPPMWNGPIAIHFAHRVGAVIVTALVLATTATCSTTTGRAENCGARPCCWRRSWRSRSRLAR